jgi:hypothetical protein
MAAPRRPEPEDFDEKIDKLIDLQQQRAELTVAIDDLYVDVATNAPTTTVAERLNVVPSTVANRREQALKRQQMRQRDGQTDRAA